MRKYESPVPPEYPAAKLHLAHPPRSSARRREDDVSAGPVYTAYQARAGSPGSNVDGWPGTGLWYMDGWYWYSSPVGRGYWVLLTRGPWVLGMLHRWGLGTGYATPLGPGYWVLLSRGPGTGYSSAVGLVHALAVVCAPHQNPGRNHARILE